MVQPFQGDLRGAAQDWPNDSCITVIVPRQTLEKAIDYCSADSYLVNYRAANSILRDLVKDMFIDEEGDGEPEPYEDRDTSTFARGAGAPVIDLTEDDEDQDKF